MEHLHTVFERLRKAGLTPKAKKCFFAQDRVTYLGHVISREGVSPDPEKTAGSGISCSKRSYSSETIPRSCLLQSQVCAEVRGCC